MTSIHVSYLVRYHENTLKQGYEVWEYRIFRTIRYTPKFGRKRGYVSYSPNVAYLARWGGGWWAAVEQNLFSNFPLKPRCVLWSENTVVTGLFSVSELHVTNFAFTV